MQIYYNLLYKFNHFLQVGYLKIKFANKNVFFYIHRNTLLQPGKHSEGANRLSSS